MQPGPRTPWATPSLDLNRDGRAHVMATLNLASTPAITLDCLSPLSRHLRRRLLTRLAHTCFKRRCSAEPLMRVSPFSPDRLKSKFRTAASLANLMRPPRHIRLASPRTPSDERGEYESEREGCRSEAAAQ